MKTTIKITLAALAIAVTAASCDPAKKTTTVPDSEEPDSTIVSDSTKKDTAVVVDSLKKDSVKK